MPWTKASAKKHTKEADTPKKKKKWSEVANSALEKGDSDGAAIRQANAVVKKKKAKK